MKNISTHENIFIEFCKNKEFVKLESKFLFYYLIQDFFPKNQNDDWNIEKIKVKSELYIKKQK